MDNNYLKTGLLTSFIFLLINDMTSKFIAGFITGVFISSKYDFKPYVSLIENKIINLQKEIESKKEEIESKKEEIKQNKPRVTENKGFNWPWSDNNNSKKN
jgi:hypothetical protein